MHQWAIIIHIFDDFVILEKSHEACAASLQWFLHFCEDIGILVAPEKKTEDSSQVLTFPMEKVDKILRSVPNLVPRKQVPIAHSSLEFCLFGHYPWQSFYSATDKPHHWCQMCTPQVSV